MTRMTTQQVAPGLLMRILEPCALLLGQEHRFWVGTVEQTLLACSCITGQRSARDCSGVMGRVEVTCERFWGRFWTWPALR